MWNVRARSVQDDTREANGFPVVVEESTQSVRRVLVFTIVTLALLIMSIDSTIVATVLHTLQHGLHTSMNWAAWTITAYSFGFVLMLPIISGKLSEQHGHPQYSLARSLSSPPPRCAAA